MQFLNFLRLYRWRRSLMNGQLVFIKLKHQEDSLAYFDFYLLNGYAHVLYDDRFMDGEIIEESDDYVKLTNIYPV
ncbi:MAG: hypothetical protein ACOH1N_14185 [Lutibacter sp.]